MFIIRPNYVIFSRSVPFFTLKSKLNVLTCNMRFKKFNILFCSYLHNHQTSLLSKNFCSTSNFEKGLILVELLEKQLSCSKEKATLLVEQNYKFLSNVEHDKLSESIMILKKNNVLASTIQEYFWLLTFNKDSLTSRLNLFNTWNFNDSNNGICILKLPFKVLMKLTKRTQLELLINGMNRITYFASYVKCDEKLACELFMKYRFMMSIDMEAMKAHLKIMKDQDIVTEDLLSDLWVFRYRLEFVTNRVQLLDEIGAKEKCKVIKPWMLRCTEKTINRYFELREENMAALGSYSNLQELLSNELGLSSIEVDEMISKHPSISSLRYCKAKDMIDFLKAEGFNSRMIYHVPRVLCHKQATLAARLVELKKINPRVINLQNLCRNKKDFVAFVNKISQT